MSFDASRIAVDPKSTLASYTVQVSGDETVASFDLRVSNGGYIFSLSDTRLSVAVFDSQDLSTPIGKATQTFSVRPGDHYESSFTLPMSTAEYQKARGFDILVTVEGTLAIEFEEITIPFVTFVMIASDETAR